MQILINRKLTESKTGRLKQNAPACGVHKLRRFGLYLARLGGLFGPLALTPSGSPSHCSGVPQPTAWVSVEPLIGSNPPSYTKQNASACEVHKLRRLDLNMARLGGFEPPTAWFVARYSIQLSYASTHITFKTCHFRKNGGEGGIRTLDRATNPILP